MSNHALYGNWVPENIQFWGLCRDTFQIHLSGVPKYYDNDAEMPGEPGVEYQMATQFIRNITLLSDIDPEEPILIQMMTCGGLWEFGMAIYDAIQLCPNPVTILAYAHARSMSSIILQAADRRVLTPNAVFMFHMGTRGLEGTQKQVQTQMDLDNRIIMPTMMTIYVERLKAQGKFKRWSRERIEKMLRNEMDRVEDVFLTATEAVEWGFVDSVFEGNWINLRAEEVRPDRYDKMHLV